MPSGPFGQNPCISKRRRDIEWPHDRKIPKHCPISIVMRLAADKKRVFSGFCFVLSPGCCFRLLIRVRACVASFVESSRETYACWQMVVDGVVDEFQLLGCPEAQRPRGSLGDLLTLYKLDLTEMKSWGKVGRGFTLLYSTVLYSLTFFYTSRSGQRLS